jgi:hypothetical protein
MNIKLRSDFIKCKTIEQTIVYCSQLHFLSENIFFFSLVKLRIHFTNDCLPVLILLPRKYLLFFRVKLRLNSIKCKTTVYKRLFTGPNSVTSPKITSFFLFLFCFLFFFFFFFFQITINTQDKYCTNSRKKALNPSVPLCII